MRAFKMSEISAVDRPAQVGARATIMKRDDGEPYWKRDFSQDQRDHLASTGAALPDGSFPIQNGSDLENAIHAIGRATDPAKAKAHIISRAKSLGLTSQLPDGWVSKIGKVLDMTPDELQKLLDESIAKATAPLAAELTALKAAGKKKPPPVDDGAEPDADDAMKAAWHKVIAKRVAEAIEATKAEMQAAFDKAAEIAKGDETFESEGVVIRKSEVGEPTFKLLKSQAEKLELGAFEKKAQAEIANLPGELTLKAKVLRTISKLDKDVREGLEAMLKGGSAAVRTMSKSAGVTAVEASSVEGQLEGLVGEYATKNNVSKAEAYAKVLETAAGAELYNKMRVEKRSAA